MERNYAARLSIAWVFGNEKFFKMAANTLVLLCKYNKDGQLIDPFGTRIDDLLPPGLLGKCLMMRFVQKDNLLIARQKVYWMFAEKRWRISSRFRALNYHFTRQL